MKTTKTNVKKLDQNHLDSENLANQFIYFEDLEANPELLEQLIQQDLKEIEEGKGTPIEEFIQELAEKFDFIEVINDDNYDDFKNYEPEFPPEVYEKIEKGLQDIKEGRYRPIEEFIAEMEEKYHINE